MEDFFMCRYCSRTDCGCIYKLTVTLLNENQEVLAEFQPDEVILDPDTDDCTWKKVKSTLDSFPKELVY